MGSRYAFIVLSVWLEHHLSRGDYRRHDQLVPAGVADPEAGSEASGRADAPAA